MEQANSPIWSALLPQILSAVIIASGYIVAALIARWGGKHKHAREELKKQLDQSLTGPDSLSASLREQLFGFSVGKVIKSVKIKMDGSSASTITREGVKATNQTILHFSHSYGSTVHSAKASDPLLHRGARRPKPLKIQVTHRSKGERKFAVAVQGGGLSPADGQLQYSYSYTISRSFYMAREDLEASKRLFKVEHASLLVGAPAKVLELEVHFPPGYSPECYAGCFAGYTEFVNERELQRTKAKENLSPFPNQEPGAKMRIEKPLVGFRYGIYWVPLSREKYDKVRSA